MTAKKQSDDKKLQALEEELNKLKDLAARAQADLQNAKSRMEKEAAEIRKFAIEGLLMQLLPTFDNFQRAFAHLPEELEDHEWVRGVAAVERDLISKLSEVGLQKIDALGQPLDPAKHEVLQTGEGEKDTVIEVIEDGYEFHGKVLRPAKVIVAQ